MNVFKQILAWILTAFAFLFPWFTKETVLVPNTYTVAGQTLTVVLDSNPTTGFSWQYSIDGDGIAFRESTYHSDTENENICGAGGKTQFVFSAKSEGAFKITFTYSRPWEDLPADRAVTIEGHTSKDGTITVSRSDF